MTPSSKPYVFLNEHDLLRADDLCRPMHDIGQQWLESPEPYMWRTVKEELPAWIGKTLFDFHDFGDYDMGPYIQMFEVIRENIT